MEKWVEAADVGKSVTELIPVNVGANKEHAKNLKSRIAFIEERILSEYQEDLKA